MHTGASRSPLCRSPMSWGWPAWPSPPGGGQAGSLSPAAACLRSAVPAAHMNRGVVHGVQLSQRKWTWLPPATLRLDAGQVIPRRLRLKQNVITPTAIQLCCLQNRSRPLPSHPGRGGGVPEDCWKYRGAPVPSRPQRRPWGSRGVLATLSSLGS